jgi:hypothetical protein
MSGSRSGPYRHHDNCAGHGVGTTARQNDASIRRRTTRRVIATAHPISSSRIKSISESTGGILVANKCDSGAIDIEGMDVSVGTIPSQRIAHINGDSRNGGRRTCGGVAVLGPSGIDDSDGNSGSIQRKG